jgi:hypothetical protein
MVAKGYTTPLGAQDQWLAPHLLETLHRFLNTDASDQVITFTVLSLFASPPYSSTLLHIYRTHIATTTL